MNGRRKLVRAVVAGRAFGVTTATILAWHRRGWIPSYRAGRRPVLFDLDEVRRALASRAGSGRAEVSHVQ